MQSHIFKYLISWLIGFAVWATALAQQPAFYPILADQGLPSSEIYQVLQDDFGFLWVGCDAGLYRYDGFHFKEFSTVSQNGRAISQLQKDKRGRIWGKNFHGQVFRVQGDSLQLVIHQPTANPNDPQYVLDAEARLWTSKGSVLIRYAESDAVEEQLALAPLKLGESIIRLQYLDGKIYGLTQELTVFEFDPSTRNVRWLHWQKLPIGKPTTTCSFLQDDEKIYLFTETTDENRHYSLTEIADKSMVAVEISLRDHSARGFGIAAFRRQMWFHTARGAWTIDPKSGLALSETIFPEHQISSIMQDREGILWFSTLDDGMLVVPNPVVEVLNNSNSNLSENALTSLLLLPDSTLLLGTYGGNLFNFNPKQKQTTQVYAAPNEFIIAVSTMLQMGKFTLVSRGRLCVIDHQTGRQYFPPLSNVRDMAIRKDKVVMVFSNFIAQLPFQELMGQAEYETIHPNGGKAVEYSPQHDLLYFSLTEGVFVRDASGNWEELQFNARSIRSTSLHYDAGILWIGTVADGVIGFEGRKAKYHFTKADLLSENEIRIVKSKNGFLWVGTYAYLHRINLKANTAITLGNAQSISPFQINAIELANGKVYLATKKGLLSFPENIVPSAGIQPQLKIIGIEANGAAIPIASKIQLSHSAKNFKISFAAILLSSKGGLSYQYRIVGLTDRWIQVSGESPEIILASPPTGKNRIEIQALNPDGPNSEILQIDINVALPFTQKWWFYALLGLGLAAILSVIFLLRIRQIRRKANLLNRLVSSQLATLRSQMSPHFMFNTLTSLQDLILEKDIKAAIYYLSKFSRLLRNILDYSSRETITLAEEIQMLETYLELQKLRLGEEFEWKIAANNIAATDQLHIPPMLIQPIVENGIKHGLLHKKGHKLIQISFSEADGLICIVEDNGIGRKAAQEIQHRNTIKHQSFATGALQQRIDLLNLASPSRYTFTILDLEQAGLATGTRVEMHFPLQFTKSN